MDVAKLHQGYLRSRRENPSIGVARGIRPEISLEVARGELAEAISRVAGVLLERNFGPLLSAVSVPALNEYLMSFESNLVRARGDLTLIIEELLDRTT